MSRGIILELVFACGDVLLSNSLKGNLCKDFIAVSLLGCKHKWLVGLIRGKPVYTSMGVESLS